MTVLTDSEGIVLLLVLVLVLEDQREPRNENEEGAVLAKVRAIPPLGVPYATLSTSHQQAINKPSTSSTAC
jgi:hypothetical protein